MAKQKKIELKECVECVFSIPHQSKTVCTLRVKDKITETSYVVRKDCPWYRKKNN
jgi:Zn ribbon nucleic-acid-binding protein